MLQETKKSSISNQSFRTFLQRVRMEHSYCLKHLFIQTRTRRIWSLFTFSKTLKLQYGDFLVDFMYIPFFKYWKRGVLAFWLELNDLGDLTEGACA